MIQPTGFFGSMMRNAGRSAERRRERQKELEKQRLEMMRAGFIEEGQAPPGEQTPAQRFMDIFNRGQYYDAQRDDSTPNYKMGYYHPAMAAERAAEEDKRRSDRKYNLDLRQQDQAERQWVAENLLARDMFEDSTQHRDAIFEYEKWKDNRNWENLTEGQKREEARYWAEWYRDEDRYKNDQDWERQKFDLEKRRAEASINYQGALTARVDAQTDLDKYQLHEMRRLQAYNDEMRAIKLEGAKQEVINGHTSIVKTGDGTVGLMDTKAGTFQVIYDSKTPKSVQGMKMATALMTIANSLPEKQQKMDDGTFFEGDPTLYGKLVSNAESILKETGVFKAESTEEDDIQFILGGGEEPTTISPEDKSLGPIYRFTPSSYTGSEANRVKPQLPIGQVTPNMYDNLPLPKMGQRG